MHSKSIRFLFLLILVAAAVLPVSCGGKNDDVAMKQYNDLVVRKNKYEANPKLHRTAIESLITTTDVILSDMKDKKNRATVLSFKAELLGLIGRIQEAEPLLKEANTLDPDNYLVSKRYGKVLYYSGRYVDAGQHFDRALLLIPRDAFKDRIEILFFVGDSFEKTKDFPRAQRAYKELITTAETNNLKNEYYTEAKKRLDELQRD